MKQGSILFLLVYATTVIAGTGHHISPGESLEKAFVQMNPGDTLHLAPGTYRGAITIPPAIHVRGKNPYTTEIVGTNRDPVLTMNRNSSISGSTITGGLNGILVHHEGVEISHCIIENNRLSGIISIHHLPHVHNTAFVNNGRHGIKGEDIGTAPPAQNLSFIRNTQGAMDIAGEATPTVSTSLFFATGMVATPGTVEVERSVASPAPDTSFSAGIRAEQLRITSLRRRRRDYQSSSHPEYGITFSPPEE
ncbi:right-handed parallel beta-helix repeat-containing protein [Chitinivibrio alkaliphilus]|uniref:Right handed beta helix domain-containing protein n=1 Tax=Chitinivibrio alkaliphilus ACht1 TaxID=1313304 RepID=U7D7P1_9BACT|nr:right-handed parallel beta-helix repeat-containing protein [Chitinivibrio alkaliphilus]ERP38970.1 hypothetical protein CALK_0461 [Chitinivibrio alkaliphilus ACht1]